MTLEEALKEIEILKLQNKKMGEAFDSLDKKYDSLRLELELAQACHKEKCAEFDKLCFDYAKLQVRNEKFEQNMKNVLEIEKKNAVEEFAERQKSDGRKSGKARLGKSDFIEGERMSWLEGYVKEFPDSTPEDIIWAWMNKNYQVTIGDEKILFDALSKVWVKYKMYV